MCQHKHDEREVEDVKTIENREPRKWKNHKCMTLRSAPRPFNDGFERRHKSLWKQAIPIART